MKIFNRVMLLALSTLVVLGGFFTNSSEIFAATKVNLGTVDNFGILASYTITNTGASVVNGNVGLSPGTSVTGFPPGSINGVQSLNNAVAVQAQADLTTAYNNAAGQPAILAATELGGTTKTTGVYNSAAGTFGLTGTLTLDAQGDSSAVFIFQTASTLITAAGSSIALINGAQACNVFWQVGSSATLGTNTTFKGNILAMASITLNANVNVAGRVLARTGAVTLDTNTITKATCVVPPASPTDSGSTPTPGSNPALPAPIPPLISIKKIPTPLALSAGAGLVTYDYTVLNIGTVAMSNVTVVDDKCVSVTFIAGDTNSDSKLDLSETWKYNCTHTLSQTTTNTVTAHGQANGLTAVDTASATVVVSAPFSPPLIHLIKKPSVFVLPLVGGIVTYTYTVTNPGVVALSNVSVVDDKCSPVSGNSGDVNSNNMLDVSETWVHTCETNLTATTTNTGTAEGSANGLTAIDFSLATVVVTPPVTIPGILTPSEVTPPVATPPATTYPKLPNAGINSSDKNNMMWNVVSLASILAALGIFSIIRKNINKTN